MTSRTADPAIPAETLARDPTSPGRMIMTSLSDARFHEARAYAWGRQDTGDEPHDSDRATDFAHAYAHRGVAFAAEQVFCLPNLRAADEEWRATGAITGGHHAPRPRLLPSPVGPRVG